MYFSQIEEKKTYMRVDKKSRKIIQIPTTYRIFIGYL